MWALAYARVQLGEVEYFATWLLMELIAMGASISMVQILYTLL